MKMNNMIKKNAITYNSRQLPVLVVVMKHLNKN